MVNTRKIAEDIMAYSKAHENDALARKPGFIGWETPYYCQTIDEIESEVIEYGYKSTAAAIKDMTKQFIMYNDYAEDIRGYGDSPMRPGTDEWDEFIDYEINRVNS
jgi:hypothetical protein